MSYFFNHIPIVKLFWQDYYLFGALDQINLKYKYKTRYQSAQKEKMKSNLTKDQLQQKINVEELQNKKIFFTLMQKARNLIGSKDIILTFCPEDNKLYYLNDDFKLPFQSEANIKKSLKKDVAQASRVEVTNPVNSKELIIKYFKKKNEKGQQQKSQWKLTLVNQQIARDWYLMLTNFQKQRNNLKKQQNQNKSLTKQPYSGTKKYEPQKVPEQSRNVSYISDRNDRNDRNDRKEEKDIKKQQLAPIQFLLTDSRIIAQEPEKDNNQGKLNYNGNNLVNNSSISKNNLPMNTQYPRKNMQLKNEEKVRMDQSRLSIAYEQTSKILDLRDSKIKPQNEGSVSNDWNFRFAKNPTRQTILQFQKVAVGTFKNALDDSKRSESQLFIADSDGLSIKIAANFTKSSKRLKKQFRNYHYILECCKNQLIIHVPLTCLIQSDGSVGLIKAKFPRDAQRIQNIRNLQSFLTGLKNKTKIESSIFSNNQSSFYNLTKFYGTYGQSDRIYVDNLIEYLPELKMKRNQKEDENYFFIRPQLINCFQNRILNGGYIDENKNAKAYNQLSYCIDAQVKDIADCLSAEELYITNYFDLKQFLHYRGVNMKFLYRLYVQTKNKFVKKYLLTCLVAKIIKDEINFALAQVPKQQMQQYLEEQIRLLVQGKTAITNQLWKKFSIKFRNLYGSSLNTHQLVGGFFLSCLMTLLPATYRLQRLDKSKVIFRDQEIILNGFVSGLKPKVKSYYRFDSKIVQTIQICKSSLQSTVIFGKLVQYMKLKSNPIPEEFKVNESVLYILGYLSSFVPPEKIGRDTLPCSRQIYQLINMEPPNAPSLKITLTYFNQYIKYLINERRENRKPEEHLEKQLKQSIDIINYWLEFQHPKVCEFYQKVSAYEDFCGDPQESLKILQKSIQIAYKTEAKNSKKIGMRHYVAGGQYLKAGKKKQAIQNLQKAKVCLQKSEGQEHEYALVLLKLSSLQLNHGDTDTCIKLGKEALKSAQKGNLNDSYKIKICQILCRAFQIKGEKQELRKLSLMCAKEYQKTKDRNAYNQMVKICLTSIMARLNLDRSKSLLDLALKLKQKNQVRGENQSLSILMQRSKSSQIMQSFMQRSDNVQKYLNDLKSNKTLSIDSSDYNNVLSLVTGCVGIDFIEGLSVQKQFQ